MAKRITICDEGAKSLDQNARNINIQFSESIQQTEIAIKEQLNNMRSLKKTMLEMDTYLVHLIKESNKKVSLKNFDRASSMIDKYDFSQCCTRRNFRQKVTSL